MLLKDLKGFGRKIKCKVYSIFCLIDLMNRVGLVADNLGKTSLVPKCG